jgi:hypothetical protein
MDLTQTRYVAITLTEPEWESLRAIQPDPCRWLKQQVHQLLEENGHPSSSASREPQAPSSLQEQIV